MYLKLQHIIIVSHFWAAVFISSIVLILIYRLGLEAGFVLDDYGPLKHLAFGGGVNTLGELVDYLKMGFAVGPAGRPVALLSFLPQADAWPHSSAPFLIINIIIHVVTTGLLAGFLRSLFRSANIQNADHVALFAAAFWAFHPWHVSTVLYAVQRMTSLAMLFSIVALWVYIPLRKALQEHKLGHAIGWSAILGSTSLLAFGSKESAVLIPQFILITEWLLAVNSKTNRNTWLQTWLLVVAWVPCLYVWYYLVQLGVESGGYGRRNFDLVERLYTEIGVIGYYIYSIFVPKIITPGLFYDGYPVVRDFLSSPHSMLWAVFHVCAITTALTYRHRWPLLFFSVFWFYGDHLLESTTIPLELVFEHRNYMPSAGASILLAVGLSWLYFRFKVGRLVVAAVFVALALLLAQRVTFWGNPVERAIIWADALPESKRAQENAFMELYKANNIDLANYYLERSIRLAPNDPYLKLKKMSRDCQFYGEVSLFKSEELAQELIEADKNFLLYRLLHGLLPYAAPGNCKGLTLSIVDDLAMAALLNPQIKGSSIRSNLNQLRGEIFLIKGEFDSAENLFELAIRQTSDKSVALYQARLLAMHGEFVRAVAILDNVINEKTNGPFLRSQAEEVKEKIQNDM